MTDSDERESLPSQALDAAISAGELEVTRVARAHFVRAEELRNGGRQNESLSHYRKAYSYRLEEVQYTEAYGETLSRQRHFELAADVYRHAIHLHQQRIEHDRAKALEGMAAVSTNLASVYGSLNRGDEAERLNREAITYWEELNADVFGNFDAMIGACRCNLAVTYRKASRFDEALQAYERAVATYRTLAAGDPENFRLILAATLNNVGGLYKDLRRFDEAEAALTEAATACRLQHRDGQDVPLLATVLLTAGTAAAENQQRDRAKAFYLESREILRRLHQSDPSVYAPSLAKVMWSMARLEGLNGNPGGAESGYIGALEILRDLAKTAPQTYEPELVPLLYNLGTLYMSQEKFREANSMFDEALLIQRRPTLAARGSQLPSLARILHNIGVLYYKTKWFKEAETAFTEAVTLRRELSVSGMEVDFHEFALSLHGLGILHTNSYRIDKGEALINEALAIRQGLAQRSPMRYAGELAASFEALMEIYTHQKRKTKAELMRKEWEAARALAGATVNQPLVGSELSAITNPAQDHDDSKNAVVIGQNSPGGIRMLKGSKVHLITRKGGAPTWTTKPFTPIEKEQRLQTWIAASLSPNVCQLQAETYYFTTTI